MTRRGRPATRDTPEPWHCVADPGTPRRGRGATVCDDAGGVTLTACLALAALLAMTLLIGQVGAAVVGRHHVQSAADLAALAAAAALDGGNTAGCARAETIARRMNVRVLDCVVADWDVTVTVEMRMSLGPLGVRPVRAAARAGPAGDIP
ncbi:Rv3654c family TadE-like protein [Nocardia huaxiensis]|uniref:Flp pilus-assembly TadE/G-like family protein n=1 Tax=Nocardia huaxiensis TaxID=2755382 RepID=A0A7D6VA04_9NOCA|nr:Rv3654c family TadE-like protein [Nocardia huaxiensis]QLY31381.1 flp pilus-assembly TadE/G-like family protein [Nocardia huaxiensis]UFS94926.1 flp pilus-assembly TadE/G-like family protein [Nocardia huaxiensis]